MKKTKLSAINKSAESDVRGFIEECEKQFDNDITEAVKTFLDDSRCDIVLLAGPSSSGKTTTAGKITEKIRESGRNAFTVSLDDFYRNRKDIPAGEDGLQDFENVSALDIGLIRESFSSLIEKRVAELPIFDFQTGERLVETRRVELEKNDVLVVEGIHALNPVITEGLDKNHVYRIYISVSSRVIADNGEILFNKRNLRLIRRMIRDAKHRNTDVESTFMQWQSVLRGEDKYLFPFESYANVRIDSFHPYEPCIFKDEALKHLKTVKEDSRFYGTVCELCDAFRLVEGISADMLPENSLLCEFLR